MRVLRTRLRTRASALPVLSRRSTVGLRKPLLCPKCQVFAKGRPKRPFFSAKVSVARHYLAPAPQYLGPVRQYLASAPFFLLLYSIFWLLHRTFLPLYSNIWLLHGTFLLLHHNIWPLHTAG